MPTHVARVLNSYDEYGNQVEVKIVDLAGTTMQHVQRAYSADGRRIEWVKYLDPDGNLSMPADAPFAAIKFEYAEDGSMSGRKRFDDKMQEII